MEGQKSTDMSYERTKLLYMTFRTPTGLRFNFFGSSYKKGTKMTFDFFLNQSFNIEVNCA